MGTNSFFYARKTIEMGLMHRRKKYDSTIVRVCVFAWKEKKNIEQFIQ